MQSLLKSLVLIFIFCLNLPAALINDDGKNFSELLNDPYRGYNRGKDWGFPYKSDYSTTLLGSNIYVEFIGNEFVRIDNNYYRISQKSDFIFNLRHKTGSGYNLYDYSSNQSIFILQYYSSEFEQAKVKCWVNGNYVQTCGPGLSDGQDETFSYFNQWYIQFLATCDSSQNQFFSKSNRSCVTCPADQSWDDESHKCFIDCTKDGKINKIAGTDGSCIDCSSEKDPMSALRCLCGGLGHGSGFSFSKKNQYDPSASSCSLVGYCSDGFQIATFTDPSCNPDNKPEKPKPDDNKTKPDDPKPNPDPGGSSGGGNSGGGNNPGDSEDKPNPDPGNNDEFCKKNPNDPKCKKDDDFCKKNPNDPKCKKKDNNSTTPGPGGGNNNGDNLKFNPDGSAGEYEKDVKGFAGKFKEAAGSIVGGFNDFKKGVDQLIANIEGKGLTEFKSQPMPKACPKKYDVDVLGKSVSFEIDYCKYLSPASNTFYYIFYILFFLVFLLGVYKTLLFLF